MCLCMGGCVDGRMECLGGDVNRIVCGMGWSGGDWVGKGDVG